MRETFANHISDLESISKIYEELIQLNSKQQNETNKQKNGQRTQIDTFPKKIYRWPTVTRKGTQYH